MIITQNKQEVRNSIFQILHLDEETGPHAAEELMSVYAIASDIVLFPDSIRTTPLSQTELNGLHLLRTIISALLE